MAKTKITDLNMHLFAQLERLNDESIKGDDMEVEIKKAKAMMGISGELIKSFKLTLEAAKLVSEGDVAKEKLPEFLIKEIS